MKQYQNINNDHDNNDDNDDNNNNNNNNINSNIDSLSNLSNQKRLIEELQEQHKIEKMQLTLQIQELKGRLEWYSKTQERLDLVTSERDRLKLELQHLKTNSKNESFSRPSDSNSILSQSTGRRNLKDIKRIK